MKLALFIILLPFMAIAGLLMFGVACAWMIYDAVKGRK